MDLFSPQSWGSSWWGFWLGANTCSHKCIVLFELKSHSISSTNTSFIDWWTIYLIDHIRVFQPQNLSLGVLENLLWVITKPDIWIFSPHKLEGVCGEGGSCVVSLVIINLFNVMNTIIQFFLFIVVYMVPIR